MEAEVSRPAAGAWPQALASLETVACNQCRSRDSRPRFPATLNAAGRAGDISAFRCTHAGYGSHHAIVQCRRCGLVYASPRWSGRTILDRYESVQDPLYLEERDGRVLTFQRHLQRLLRAYGHAPRAGERLLDVGCYIGVFVEIARDAGWEAVGLEPSSWAVSQARQRGLNVIEGTLATAELGEATFDVVTLWDVIEHLTDPLAELRLARRALKPGGLLVVHTMDVDSLAARLMGRRWPWLMEMHLYYFSRRTLAAMLAAAGFAPIGAEAQGRYLRLGYLMTRVRPFSRPLAALLSGLAQRLGWRDRAVSINFGDLFTMYARK